MRKSVLQGMRPSGRLHLGNYLGTAKGMLSLQEDPEYETFYMVADLHALTTPHDPKKIRSDAKQVIIDYLSVGLDPKKSALFLQSDLSEFHTQLSYYFSTVVTIARMQHLPTFKEKVKQHPDSVTMALLNYPVLMAADIHLYKANMVPVGIDQEPHMEIAREIARKMNSKYGTDFSEPESLKAKGRYIPSLTGEGKMSKSVEGSYINLTDDLETIKRKLAKVPTDSGKGGKRIKDYRNRGFSVTEYTDESGNVSNGVGALMTYVDLFMGASAKRRYEKLYTSSGIRYGELKEELAKAIHEELEPIQKRREELEKDSKYVEKVLEDGATKARKVAEKTVKKVKQKMGLG
ncbi:tryptophan--tRNA ligase [Patescibacteria group bacterium]